MGAESGWKPWGQSSSGEGRLSVGMELAETAAPPMAKGCLQRGHRTAVPGGSPLELTNLAAHAGQTTMLSGMASTPQAIPRRTRRPPKVAYQTGSNAYSIDLRQAECQLRRK
jgi:hypothetical protein